MALSQKTARIFTAVEVLREGDADIRHALAVLFNPILATFQGELYDPAKMAKAINEQLKLGVNRDVMEEFAPVFASMGWINKISDSQNNVAYQVIASIPSVSGKLEDDFRTEAKELAQEFRKLIEQISPLSQIQKSDEELIDILVDWMMRLDSLSESEMKTASAVQRVGHKLVYEVSAPPEISTSDDTFLAARFVKNLFDTD
jgi:hypothetical protein